MERSLFNILSHMNGAEIALGICLFLINNQPTISLPSDQDVLEVITHEECNAVLLNTEHSKCNVVANRINKLAIEYLKAYFEVTLNDQINRSQLIDMLHYSEKFDSANATESIFTISFLYETYTNPTERDLSEIENQLEQYGLEVLDAV